MVATPSRASSAAAASGIAPARTGAEAIIQLMSAAGADYIFLNPGTDTAPLQEAVVALGAMGQRVPKIVPCLYENVSLAAAHGYFSVTRRPQVVVVHVDVGTMNLGGNLHNTQRGQGGVVILAGRAPYTVEGDAPGGRNAYIQWQQDEPDQMGIVRNYSKWSHELTRTDTLYQLIPRAFQLAASEPAGAVYMTVAREVLMDRMDGVNVGHAARTLPLISPTGDPAAIDELAAWLADAKHPLAIVGKVGRNPAAVAEMVALAELLGMPVGTTEGPVSFPSSHALSLGQGYAEALKQADAILVLDTDVPWIPRRARPLDTARVAQIDMDPLKSTIPVWGFPVDLPIMADTSKALPALLAAVQRLATPARRVTWSTRGQAQAQVRAKRIEQAAELSRAARTRRPIQGEWLAAALAESVPDDAIVVDEVITSGESLFRQLRRDEPGTLLYGGGPGLGWSMGAALGARLALPERDVVAMCGDGSFVFNSPVAALWMSQQVEAPFLTVIFNNSGYRASQRPVQELFPEGMSVELDTYPGVRFNTPPDYAALARSCHAYGERVDDPDELLPAIKRGLNEIRHGRAAVLDVILEPI
ncbi:MAG: thiamine pyrophosphate-requiring protein [Chloroflexota bacterium]